MRTWTLLTLAAALSVAFATPARADFVSTSQALGLEDRGRSLETIDAYLARQDVAAELSALGVDPELARLRAAALTTSELEALAGQVEVSPAGGDALGILGATFLVLLILELVGVIDIFKRI